MPASRKTAVAMASAMAVIWGISFLSIKTAVAVVPPMTLGLARFIVASAVLFSLFAFKRAMPRLKARDIPLMAASGLTGVTIYFLGENNGVMLLSASEASIIVGTIPVLTMMAERVFAKNRLSAPQYFGAGLSAVGVALIVIESLRLSASPLGYLYMVVAALAWVCYAFMTKPLLERYDNLEITFWQSVFGALGFVPFALFEHVEWAAVTPLIVANVLYLGVFCSAIGYLFYVISLKALGAGVSSVFINLIPVVSVVASFIVLGERLSPVQLAGGAAAVAGVYLASLAGGGKLKRKSGPARDASAQ